MAAHWFVPLAASVGACASLARAHDGTQALTTDRGELILTTHDGRELRSASLVGAILEVGGMVVRLDAVEADPLGADRAPLHHFVVLPRAGKPYELCTADSSGGRWAAGVHTAPALHGWVLVIDSRKSGGRFSVGGR